MKTYFTHFFKLFCILLLLIYKVNASVIFVNDNSIVGDSYTAAVGNNLTGDGSAVNPYLTITKALSIAVSGDTIFVDAGLYSETVVINTDAISIIGADSATTIIDPPGDSTTLTLFGIYADTQTYITLQNLKITRCYRGILRYLFTVFKL